jgi:hypothetical protein
MVQYAMVPTGGIATDKAGKIARFVRAITSSSGGQVYGFAPGQLAAGYLTLSPDQQAQAANAAQHVAAQDGAPAAADSPGGGPAAAAATVSGSRPVPTGPGTASTTPAPGAPPSGPGPASATPRLLGQVAVGTAGPDRAGPARLVLPVLLITGLVLLLGGPAGLVLLGTDAGTRLVSSARSVLRAARR